MAWLSELILTAGEQGWCTSTKCGYSECYICRAKGLNQGFRLFLRVLPREEAIGDLRELSQEICDRYPHILRTVFVDFSSLQGIKAGTDLVEPLNGTPAGAVLEAAICHAQERYNAWCSKERFSSPEAARSRAEARRQKIAEDQKLRSRRRAELEKKLLIFREAIDQSDFDRFLSELQGLRDPLVVRAIGGIAYVVLRRRLRGGQLSKAELELFKKYASNFRGYWAKLVKETL